MNIKEEIKEIGRLSQIVRIFFLEGLDSLIYEIEIHGLAPLLFRFKNKFRKKIEVKYEENLTRAFQKLGGIFVKGGQYLSTRPDLIGSKYAKAFEKLEDQDIPFKFHESMMEFKEAFQDFDKKAISAASFGQVHKAMLKNNDVVAIKVRRPKIKQQVKEDLKIIHWLIKRLNKKRPDLRKLHLMESFREIKRYTDEELNYLTELKHIQKFQKILENDINIKVPKIYKNISSKDFLVMSFEEGKKISHFFGKGKKYQKILIESFTKQYFEHGFFHGDPHCGNFLVTPDDNKITILDFGIVGKLTKKERKDLLRIVVAISSKDTESLTKQLIKINTKKNKIDYKKFFASNNKILLESSNGQVYNDIISNAIEIGIDLPTDYIIFGKSILTLSSLCKELNPKMVLDKEMRPHIIKILMKTFPPKTLIKLEIKDLKPKILKSAGKLIDNFAKKFDK